MFINEAENISSKNCSISQNVSLGRMIDLQLFVYDNIGKALKENIPVSSVETQAKPLLETLEKRIEDDQTLRENDKKTAINHIHDLQQALHSGYEYHVSVILDRIYCNLIETIQSREISPGHFKPAHIIAQNLHSDPFLQYVANDFLGGKAMFHGWRVIFLEEAAAEISSDTPAKSSLMEFYSAHISLSSKTSPSRSLSSLSTPNSCSAFSSAPTSGAFGGLGQKINQKNRGEITVLTFNVRTADVGQEMEPAHNWEARKESVMKVLTGKAPLNGNIHDVNAPKVGPSDFIGLQEVNHSPHKKVNGLTQAEYIVQKMPKNYGRVPSGQQLESRGLMILYNKSNLTPDAKEPMRTISLGFDPEGIDQEGKIKPGEYNRQIIGQRFKINGTVPERYVWYWNGHGPHNNKKAVEKALEEIKKLNTNNDPVIIGGDWNEDFLEDVKNGDEIIAKTTTDLQGIQGEKTKIGSWNEKGSDDFKLKGANDTIFVQGPIDLQASRGAVYDIHQVVNKKKVAISDHRPVQEVLKLDYNQKN